VEAWAGRGDAWRSAQCDADLQKLMAQIKAELDHLCSLGDEASCRLCGKQEALTEENAPSKAAGNAGPLLGVRVDDDASRGPAPSIGLGMTTPLTARRSRRCVRAATTSRAAGTTRPTWPW